MFGTLKKFLDFCNKQDAHKIRLAIVLGVVRAVFAALRITAIAVVANGIISGNMDESMIWIALGIMGISIIGQLIISLKTTMLQCEGGFHSCANKRIEIAEHLRYLPMGFFNANSLGQIQMSQQTQWNCLRILQQE